MTPRVAILGTRGVPATHGGFETLAHHLSLYLAARGWDVTVYCQAEGRGPATEDAWNGVRRVTIPTPYPGAMGTVHFDWRSVMHAARCEGTALVLGYNTAAFLPVLRGAGRHVVLNMDGIEWRRGKWSPTARVWLRANERIGATVAHSLIADHPEIKRHVATFAPAHKITTIAYGANAIDNAPVEPVRSAGLEPGRYLLVVARVEPENSVLPIVRSFSRRPRGVQLAVVGPLAPSSQPYHAAVASAAGVEVRFLGPVYEPTAIAALRFHARAYVHGHTVGGTNPSLVEALGAGNAVVAHANPFNRWVAGDAARYFVDEDDLDGAFDAVTTTDVQWATMRLAARDRFREAFTWPAVLERYEQALRAGSAP